jgi:hypothetical protein
VKSTSWKEIAELTGITAIVASLILVAFELRQNTNAVRATAVQEATTVARDQILMFAQDPDMVRITLTPYSELNELDKRRAFWINRSFWIGMQGLYRQHVLGVLPDEEWQFWTRVVCSAYLDEDEGEDDLWPGNSATLAEDFVRFVEGCTSNVLGVRPQ